MLRDTKARFTVARIKLSSSTAFHFRLKKWRPGLAATGVTDQKPAEKSRENIFQCFSVAAGTGFSLLERKAVPSAMSN